MSAAQGGGGRHRHGRAANVNVTVPLSSLIGIYDAPAELAGYGPSPPKWPAGSQLTALAAAAHGPATGALLDYGQTRYAPPQELLDHVTARDRSCRLSTCSQPARRCQADHSTPAGTPGWSTSASSLGMLCASCHNGKTHAGWHLVQPEPGHFTWRAPTGHRYDLAPEPIGPIVSPAEPRGRPTGNRARLGPAPVHPDPPTTLDAARLLAFAASLRTLRSARAARGPGRLTARPRPSR